jgi:hypothetical protein
MAEDQKCWLCDDMCEELLECAECADELCSACLSEEGEDGFLCPACVNECLECGSVMGSNMSGNHRSECGICGLWTCKTRKPCCTVVCSAKDSDCEDKFYSLNRVRMSACCSRRYCLLCEDDTMQPHECTFCDLQACQQHVGRCALYPTEHHFCKSCSLEFCQDCLCLECPTCGEHTPWACLLSKCRACSVGLLCARHMDDHCGTCGKGYDGAGACPDCRVAIELVLFRVLPEKARAVLPLIRALLGSRHARIIQQIPSASKRLNYEFQNFMTWSRVTSNLRGKGTRVLPSFFKRSRSHTMMFAALSVTERVIATEEVLRTYNLVAPFQKGSVPPKLKVEIWVHAIRRAIGCTPCVEQDCDCKALLASTSTTLVGSILWDKKRRKVA